MANTLLSTFELLFTPQLPPNVPLPTPVGQIGENVIKGYFLTLSNPNPTSYVFDIGLNTSANLASVAAVFFDGTSPGLSVPLQNSAPNWYLRLTVPADGTVLLGVLPAFFTTVGFAAPVIDVRGYVDITLPALLQGGRFVAQASSPVQVLVTPEQRLTFLPSSTSGSQATEAQAAFVLPVAGGNAALQVPPVPGFSIFPGPRPGPGPGPGPHPLPEATSPISARVRTLLEAQPGAAAEMLASLLELTPAVAKGDVKMPDLLGQLGIS